MNIITTSILLLLMTLTCAGSTEAGAGISRKPEHINTDIGYCQAIRVGNTLYISGSVGSGEMPLAIKQAYDTIRDTLKAYGLGFSSVFKENVYSTKLDEFIANKNVRSSYYAGVYPSATWVEVKRLYVPELVVEVEVVALIPATK